MKTIGDWEKEIIRITTKIQTEFPELVKYFKEIPVPNSSGASITEAALKDYYNSLVDILGEYAKTHPKSIEKPAKKVKNNKGYPLYPVSEDIYAKGKKEMDLDPAEPTQKKSDNPSTNTRNEKDFDEDMSGDDLDVPGSELDDDMEEIGSEDEENNYYSLGGDNHNDLDENDDE